MISCRPSGDPCHVDLLPKLPTIHVHHCLILVLAPWQAYTSQVPAWPIPQAGAVGGWKRQCFPRRSLSGTSPSFLASSSAGAHCAFGQKGSDSWCCQISRADDGQEAVGLSCATSTHGQRGDAAPRSPAWGTPSLPSGLGEGLKHHVRASAVTWSGPVKTNRHRWAGHMVIHQRSRRHSPVQISTFGRGDQ